MTFGIKPSVMLTSFIISYQVSILSHVFGMSISSHVFGMSRAGGGGGGGVFISGTLSKTTPSTRRSGNFFQLISVAR